ncbi:MAG: hypothetical protein Q9225_003380 [Loekoesia sp. 1 TL-2023]
MADSPANGLATGGDSESGRTPTKKIVARQQEKARENGHKASPKNGIPPKRTMVSTERKANSTPPAVSGPTVSSASRNTLNGNLAKSSARSPANVDGRRSKAAANTSGSSVAGRKPRNSVSSADSFTNQRSDQLNGRDEDIDHKPLYSGERVGSVSPVKPMLTSSSKPSSLATSTATGRRPHSTVAYSSKAASTRELAEARMQSGQKSARNGRIGPGPKQTKTASNGSISKTASIRSASPQANAASVKSSDAPSVRPLSSPKKMRPGLGTRKSTMSVTIEQRLREMSLVHEMLRAAMAEDGDENDEVKEEYGKQMDETLAALKARLEEAKSNEGILSSEAELDVKTMPKESSVHSPDINGGTAGLQGDDRTEDESLQGAIEGDDVPHSRGRETELLEQLEGVDISAVDKITHPELRVTKLELLKARSDYEGLQASSLQEVNSFRETIESLTSGLHSVQASHQSTEREVVRLETVNQGLQERLQERDSNHEREIQHYKDTIEELRKNQSQLIETKDSEIHASRKAAHDLEGEISEIQESKQHVEEDAHQINKALQDRMQQLRESSERELSRYREALEALESRLGQYQEAKTKDLEKHSQIIAALHHELDEVQANKNRELKHQQEVIEVLQDRIRDLNETKERELEIVKQSLAKEHEEAVTGLQLELDNVLAKKAEDIRQQDDSRESAESSIEALKNTYQSQLDQLRATLASVHASNTELRHNIDDNKGRHEEVVSSLKAELERSMAEEAKLRAEIDYTRQQFSDLGKERNDIQSVLQSNEEALKQMSENVASLQQQLAALNNEEIALLEKNAQAEKELATARKLLDDMRRENQQLSAHNQDKLEEARKLRAELEYRAFEGQEAYNEMEFERVIIESRMDLLRSKLAEARSGRNGVADQELAMLRADVQAANKAKAELESELHEAREKYKVQLRELESALKVTTAELVELRTERPNGSSYSGSPIPKSGLRSSRWAKVDGNGSGEGDGALVGEELSSHIQGQV